MKVKKFSFDGMQKILFASISKCLKAKISLNENEKGRERGGGQKAGHKKCCTDSLFVAPFFVDIFTNG